MKGGALLPEAEKILCEGAQATELKFFSQPWDGLVLREMIRTRRRFLWGLEKV